MATQQLRSPRTNNTNSYSLSGGSSQHGDSQDEDTFSALEHSGGKCSSSCSNYVYILIYIFSRFLQMNPQRKVATSCTPSAAALHQQQQQHQRLPHADGDVDAVHAGAVHATAAVRDVTAVAALPAAAQIRDSK